MSNVIKRQLAELTQRVLALEIEVYGPPEPADTEILSGDDSQTEIPFSESLAEFPKLVLALSNEDLYFPSHLVGYNDEQLLGIKGVGPASVEKLRELVP